MKKNRKGFMLIETLIVSISISGILLYLYLQFSNVNNSYNKSFNYNSVEGLYLASDIKENILYNGLENIYNEVDNNAFIDLSDCNSNYSNINYCNSLYEIVGVKTVILTKNNLNDIKELMKSSTNVNKYSETLRDFISKISDSKEGYQLIVEYNNATVSEVNIVR